MKLLIDQSTIFFILKCVPKIPLYNFATHHILFFPFSHCGKETSRFRTLKKVQKRVKIWKAQHYLTYFESTCSESTAWCLLQLGHLLKLSGNLNHMKFMKTKVFKFIIPIKILLRCEQVKWACSGEWNDPRVNCNQ